MNIFELCSRSALKCFDFCLLQFVAIKGTVHQKCPYSGFDDLITLASIAVCLIGAIRAKSFTTTLDSRL